MADLNKVKINYIIGINQKISAALNRVESIKRGFDLNNVQNEIFIVNVNSKRFAIFRKLKAYIFIFYNLLKARRGDVFILYGSLPYYVFVPMFKKKLRFIVERNEFPAYLIKQGVVKSQDRKKEERLLTYLKYFDGLITCSHSLSSYYNSFLADNAKTLICPLVIDVDKFSQKNETIKSEEDYFAYCGRLGNNKDGVPILIDSFASFAAEVDAVKLYIIGNGSTKIENELYNKAVELKVENRIVFTGAISHEQLIPILQRAKLLLLARPNNKQAEGGIPSKIGEYMAVKVPIVVTRVGELESFLTDSVNCFMAEPDSVESFKLKMIEGFYYPDRDRIVQNAFKTVEQFDIKKQSKLIYEFCTTI